MNLDRIIHPLKHVPNTEDTIYDKYGRASMVLKKGKWNLANHKDLKNFTPDGDPRKEDDMPTFAKGDIVYIKAKSLFGRDLDGNFIFDSYDAWDNTCYVSRDGKGTMCYWMDLNDLTLIARKDEKKKK